MLKNRRSRLIPFFEQHSLDAILFSDLKNIRYLTGFSGSEGALLQTPDIAYFLCDSRYVTQASNEVKDSEIHRYTVRTESISALLQELGLKRTGFDAAYTTVATLNALSAAVSVQEFVPLGVELDDIRACKDLEELELMASVAELASDSLASVIPRIHAGIRESDIALELEIEMRRRGASGRSFDFIVASGERGVMPHGVASERCIQSGELVTIDFGAMKDGYCSDETVTIAVGEPDARMREIFAIVLQAHDLALAAVKPGIPCKELDAVARMYIAEQGYGEYFGHGLGHGVGLDIHERPVISPRSTSNLSEGMVITIEPGIYIPGTGGVRIEDTVAVTSEGCRILTKTPKELLVI